MTEHHPTKTQEDADPNTPPAKRAPHEHGKPDQLKDKEKESLNQMLQEMLLKQLLSQLFMNS